MEKRRKGLGRAGWVQGLLLPWLLHLGMGEQEDPPLQLEGAGSASPDLQKEHFGCWLWISGLLLESCAEQAPQAGQAFTSAQKQPKMCPAMAALAEG